MPRFGKLQDNGTKMSGLAPAGDRIIEVPGIKKTTHKPSFFEMQPVESVSCHQTPCPFQV